MSGEEKNEWIEWKGGICPVHVDTLVMYRLRHGWVSDGPVKAGLCRWDHGRTPQAGHSNARLSDIIAYRVVQQ